MTSSKPKMVGLIRTQTDLRRSHGGWLLFLRLVQAGSQFICQRANVRFHDHVDVVPGNLVNVQAARGETAGGDSLAQSTSERSSRMSAQAQ